MSSVGTIDTSTITLRLPDGVALHVELHGTWPDGGPRAGDGPPRGSRRPAGADPVVVFLHGWTLDSRLWHHQISELPHRLEDPRVRMVAFDLRGHGRSDPTAVRSATLDQLADDLQAVLRGLLPDDRVVLVGHSLGGMAVVEYAHRHPADFAARVAGVVLVNSSAEGALHTRYGLPDGFAHLVRAAELGGSGLLARFGPWHPHRHLMPALLPGVRWLVFGRTADRASMRLVAEMVSGASLRSIGAFRPSIETHRRVAALAAMRDVPTAVLVGARDRLTPPACGEAIAAALPHARLQVIDGAGHMLPLERPATVTDAVAEVTRRAT